LSACRLFANSAPNLADFPISSVADFASLPLLRSLALRASFRIGLPASELSGSSAFEFGDSVLLRSLPVAARSANSVALSNCRLAASLRIRLPISLISLFPRSPISLRFPYSVLSRCAPLSELVWPLPNFPVPPLSNLAILSSFARFRTPPALRIRLPCRIVGLPPLCEFGSLLPGAAARRLADPRRLTEKVASDSALLPRFAPSIDHLPTAPNACERIRLREF